MHVVYLISVMTFLVTLNAALYMPPTSVRTPGANHRGLKEGGGGPGWVNLDTLISLG
jgi:hypothetical protein